MRDLDPLSSFIGHECDRLWDPKVQSSKTINLSRELDALLVEVRA